MSPIEVWVTVKVEDEVVEIQDSSLHQELEEDFGHAEVHAANTVSVPWVEQRGEEEAWWEHCYRCRSISHKVRECPVPVQPCAGCKSKNHRFNRCPQRRQQVQEEALQLWVTAPLCLHHEECWACNWVGGQGFIANHICLPCFAEEVMAWPVSLRHMTVTTL